MNRAPSQDADTGSGTHDEARTFPTEGAAREHAPDLHLTAYYLSQDRVLGLVGAQGLPVNVRHAIQNHDWPARSAFLSNELGPYLFEAITSGQVKSLQELAIQEKLREGAQFIYHGHVFGKGFGQSNRTGLLELHEKLDAPLDGKILRVQFSKNGLLNSTAYSRMSGSTTLFTFAYIAEITEETIRAIPYVIGDLVRHASSLQLPFAPGLELLPQDIEQFANMGHSWAPSIQEFSRLKDFPEQVVKELLCKLLAEATVPRDWGGEESDLFSANLKIRGQRRTGAFLLKGPAAFRAMKMADCGKNGDQIYRLFNIPADVYILQHCHHITPAVRKTVEAFAISRSLVAPCHYIIMDGLATARLLRANALWEAKGTEAGPSVT